MTRILLLSLLYAAITFTTQSRAQNYFINPPPPRNSNDTDLSRNPVYPLGRTIDIEWSTTWLNGTILVLQMTEFQPTFLILGGVQSNWSAWAWTVSMDGTGFLPINDTVGNGSHANGVQHHSVYANACADEYH
jgi:hypothetical protein